MSIGEGVIGAGEGVVVTSQEQGQIEQDRIFRGASSFKFNGFYSRNDLPKVKRGAYTIDLEEYKSIATHWIALNVNGDNVGGYPTMQHTLIALELNIFQKKLKKIIDKRQITTNIFRIKAYSSIMYGYFCIDFIDFKLKGKRFLDYTNLFSPTKYGKNNKTILKYLK